MAKRNALVLSHNLLVDFGDYKARVARTKDRRWEWQWLKKPKKVKVVTRKKKG